MGCHCGRSGQAHPGTDRRGQSVLRALQGGTWTPRSGLRDNREGELAFDLIDTGSFTLGTELLGEYVHAELDDDTFVPRIPPLHLAGALTASTGAFDLRGEVEWYDEQNDIAPFETATDGYTFVNASIAWRPLRGANSVTLLLKADNIFDVSGRRHTSFTKDFVPLAGRNFSASLRASF